MLFDTNVRRKGKSDHVQKESYSSILFWQQYKYSLSFHHFTLLKILTSSYVSFTTFLTCVTILPPMERFLHISLRSLLLIFFPQSLLST